MKTSILGSIFLLSGLVGCAMEAELGGEQESELKNPKEVASHGYVAKGRNGVVLDLWWLQWRDGTCTHPTNNDGTPWEQGKPAGAACKYASDCVFSCNTCPGGASNYYAAACLNKVCTDATTATALVLENQANWSRPVCR
jgi:hypothetical protein